MSSGRKKGKITVGFKGEIGRTKRLNEETGAVTVETSLGDYECNWNWLAPIA